MSADPALRGIGPAGYPSASRMSFSYGTAPTVDDELDLLLRPIPAARNTVHVVAPSITTEQPSEWPTANPHEEAARKVRSPGVAKSKAPTSVVDAKIYLLTLVDEAGAAARLGITPTEWRAWHKQGRGPTARWNNGQLFTVERDITFWLENNNRWRFPELPRVEIHTATYSKHD